MIRLLVLASLCALVASAMGKPNVVLVMADDQGWGDVAYNGNPVVKTPHLDDMARTGLRFDRFYAPRFELYNLAADSGKMITLAENPNALMK